METLRLIKTLRSAAADGHRCLGCEYENKCSIHGCQLMKLAADALEDLDHRVVTGGTTAQNQAMFRLGQMDMKESVLTLLQKPAEFTTGITRTAFLNAFALDKKFGGALMKRSTNCSRRWPSFLYDFVKCEGDHELEQTLQTINENGYNLVSVTQKDDTYTVFFRRFWP